MSSYSVFSGLNRAFSVIVPTSDQEIITGQDVVIKFLSAEVRCHQYNYFITFSF